MAQLERLPKSSEFSRSPRCPTPTSEQRLQRDVFSRNYDHDHEDHHKKSVLKKVKEKAKKLKRSLSGKKKHGMEMHDDDNTSPSSGTKYEDAAEDDENPEFLGAPTMYESEQAPETLKENSQGNNTLSSCSKIEQEKEKSISPNKMTAKSASDQLAPKMEGLKITNPNEQETEACTGGTPVATSAATGAGYVSGHLSDEGLKNLERKSEFRDHSANSSQKWDKGVSVKEYFRNKLEPGEDEKALSQVISDSLSPKQSPGKGVVDKFRRAVSSLIWHDDEESQPTIKNTKQSSPTSSDTRKLQSIEANFATSPTSSSRNSVCNRSNPSPFLPVPTSTTEVVEEQNHGRILQTN